MRQIRDVLRGGWLDWLNEQDLGGGWKPHWIVVNKVDVEDEARGVELVEV